MVIRVLDNEGRPVLLVDTEGVYLIKDKDRAAMRVLSQCRLKNFSVRLVQCFVFQWNGCRCP